MATLEQRRKQLYNTHGIFQKFRLSYAYMSSKFKPSAKLTERQFCRKIQAVRFLTRISSYCEE